MDGGDAALLERRLQTQIEIRRVDPDEHVGRIGKQPARQLAADGGDFAKAAENLGIAANRQGLERIPGIKTHAKHFRTTHTKEDGVRQLRPECLDQLAGQEVARCLPGDQGDPDGQSRHRMMPRFDTARKSMSG